MFQCKITFSASVWYLCCFFSRCCNSAYFPPLCIFLARCFLSFYVNIHSLSLNNPKQCVENASRAYSLELARVEVSQFFSFIFLCLFPCSMFLLAVNHFLSSFFWFVLHISLFFLCSSTMQLAPWVCVSICACANSFTFTNFIQ